ncbi:FG-GAP-like repeat-containing protein [Vibrio paucivorans]|uniref:FG-GAP-like repeat-containing protein n=1 Tax=Vibrio paucivorans TaxID=2829489 RepID=A0A9X3HP28_9VIBR|nr:FG-GAP-like repeat-containing protein [Vibrio paucivorans]MCW8332383.1 FG-GAP-like repeat-containing protein [Vibrio paucivorans]
MKKYQSVRTIGLSLIAASVLVGCNDDSSTPEVDVVIGLGLQVNYASCSPRILLESRVDRLYKEGSKKDNPIYVVSGKGNPTSVPLCVEGEVARGKTEAKAMRNILMSKYQVPSDKILLEEESTDTITNATYVKELLDEKVYSNAFNIRSYTLVTSNYHMHRGGAGNDSSAPFYFNEEFGEGTFVEGENTFESSIIDNESIWSVEFTNNAGWDTTTDKRIAADIDGDGRADAVGFQSNEVLVGYSNGTNSFGYQQTLTSNFLPSTGNWEEAHYRTAADINGDGKDELIGFGNDGVYVAGEASGYEPVQWSSDFGSENGWTKQRHVYQMVDLNNDGKADIVAFGEDGVYVAYAEEGSFSAASKVLSNYGSTHTVLGATSGETYQDSLTKYLRLAGDVTGNGYADIVIFGVDAIYVAENTGDKFLEAKAWLGPETDEEGNHASFIEGWDNQDHYRGLADMNNNGKMDIITVGNKDITVAHSTGERFEHLNGVWFYTTENRHNDENTQGWNQFTTNSGWNAANSVRVFADVTGNGLPDIVGFSHDAVYVGASVAQ